ncbi:hypothetical protein LMG29739_00558 [Paraburkholderia solisilvae]|uniref:Uncharacterized protein n=1 Tax=Paraburkholderia solisilvae TaxID=624376 RepID=A0A6J5D641_9BURK|nr:hypothetical protein LMG29739_00558 [Paraburkholderia solisilvae]
MPICMAPSDVAFISLLTCFWHACVSGPTRMARDLPGLFGTCHHERIVILQRGAQHGLQRGDNPARRRAGERYRSKPLLA